MSLQPGKPKVLRDVILNASASYLARFIAVIQTFIFAAIFLPDELGVISLVSLILVYTSFVHIGLYNAFGREYPKLMGSGRVEEAAKLRDSAFSTSFGLAVLAALILSGWALFGPITQKWTKIAFGFGAFLTLTQQINIYYLMYLRVEKEFNFINRMNLFLPGPAAILSIILAFKFGVIGPLIGLSICGVYLYGLIPIIYILIFSRHRFRLRIDKASLVSGFKTGLPLLMVSLLDMVLMNMDRTLIANILSFNELGLYQIVVSIGQFLWFCSVAVGFVLFPLMLEHYGRYKDDYRLYHFVIPPTRVLAYALPPAVGAAWLLLRAPIDWLLPNYSPAIPVISIYLPGIFFWCLVNMHSYFLTATDRLFDMAKLQVQAVVLNIIFCLIFTVRLDYGLAGVGAAVSISFVYYYIRIIIYNSSILGIAWQERIRLILHPVFLLLYIYIVCRLIRMLIEFLPDSNFPYIVVWFSAAILLIIAYIPFIKPLVRNARLLRSAAPAPAGGSPRILFVPSNGTHVKMFQPIYERTGGKILSLDRYYGYGAEGECQKLGLAYDVLPGPPEGKTVSDLSAYSRFACYRRAVKLVNRRIEGESPDIVIFGNDMKPLERMFIRRCRDLGIPTLLIQDGIIRNCNPGFWGVLWPGQTIGKLIVKSFLAIIGIPYYLEPELGTGGCDAVAVMGERSRDILLDKKVPAGRIHVTGQPRYDNYVESVRSSGGPKPEGLPAGKKVVMFASQPFLQYNEMTPKNYIDLQKTIVNELAGMDEIYFVVKLHPRENPDYYKEVISSCHAQPDRILYTEDLRSWLSVTDILVTVNSTVAIEAIIFGVTVILANFSASPYFLDYDSYGAVRSAPFFEDVKNDIRLFLEYPEEEDALMANSEKLIRAELGPRDGMAADRIVNLISLLTNASA